MHAAFVARSRDESRPLAREACWVSGRFEGDALLRGAELELVMPRAWIAVTRDNDKQWDDLHLTVEVSRHPLGPQSWAPIATSATMVLRPTVDSAGPQLTTWQSADTLRLLVPWTNGLEPRWLLFRLHYQTLNYHGGRAQCDGVLGTDTLRFGAR